jgi:hypothetical protein
MLSVRIPLATEWDGSFEWEDGVKPTSMDHPQRAIDAFMSLVEPEMELLHKGYQVFLRKRAGTRHSIKAPPAMSALLPPHEFVFEVGILLPLRCSDEWSTSRRGVRD